MKTESGIFLQLEEIPCCVCGERSGKTCLEGYDIEFRTCDNKFRFLECAGCYHTYLSPRPRPSEMDIIYRNYLTTNRNSAYYPSPLVAWIKDNLFDRLRLRPVLRHLQGGSNVLDIGAGAGRLLLQLRHTSRAAINLYANDLSFDAMTREKFAKENIHILVGSVELCDSPVKFDAIMGIHVIEHVLDPRAFFLWAYNNLNPGGLLYLETPDADTVLRRLFRNNWGHTHFPGT